MHDESRDHIRQDLPGGDPGEVEALLTGGDPRSLRNATVVIDAASRQPGRLAELVQCVFSPDEIVRMRASDALEQVCRAHRGPSSAVRATATGPDVAHRAGISAMASGADPHQSKA